MPKSNAQKVAEHRVRVKQRLVDEAGGKCVRCGYDKCLAALVFHHRDPATKLFGIAAKGHTKAFALLSAEAKKCDLLCANCHAEVHHTA